MHRDRQQKRLRSQILREALDCVEQTRGALVGSDGLAVDLGIPHGDRHVLCEMQQNLFVIALERDRPAARGIGRLGVTIVRRRVILWLFVDRLEDADTGTFVIYDRHSDEAPRYVSRLFVDGLVEAPVLVAVMDVYCLLRVEDASRDALAWWQPNRRVKVRGVQEQHTRPPVENEQGNHVAIYDVLGFPDHHVDCVLRNNLGGDLACYCEQLVEVCL
mmetsp:Transcript_89373/g.251682  ORF Transcript_89373/g.251682 Transcript_89373/m.251682 type:complete len:217 (-) Transcript_89373:240-890(-)